LDLRLKATHLFYILAYSDAHFQRYFYTIFLFETEDFCKIYSSVIVKHNTEFSHSFQIKFSFDLGMKDIIKTKENKILKKSGGFL